MPSLLIFETTADSSIPRVTSDFKSASESAFDWPVAGDGPMKAMLANRRLATTTFRVFDFIFCPFPSWNPDRGFRYHEKSRCDQAQNERLEHRSRPAS